MLLHGRILECARVLRGICPYLSDDFSTNSGTVHRQRKLRKLRGHFRPPSLYVYVMLLECLWQVIFVTWIV